MLSFIVIDSRSDIHPDWVQTCIRSINSQTQEIETIVVNNIGRKKSIGKCFNEGVKAARNDWVVFVGDDDYVAPDYADILLRYINESRIKSSRVVNVATYMTAFNNDTGQKTALARQSTGAWKREYLLKHPFNEDLEKGIDREYIEETVKRGDLIAVIEYYFGYFYRRHSDYRCAGDIIFEKEPAKYYFVTANRIFLSPITERIAKLGKVFVDNSLTPELAKKAEVIWCEWANEKAIDVAEIETNAKKILRIHAYEAFSETLKRLDLNKFDVVIFIDNYIKEYVERQYGKVNGAVVIPNGIDLEKFYNPNKIRNNKIAYAGYLTRKKGIGELILLAESFPDYEFHIAGKYQEDDIADFLNIRKPNNIKIHPWQYSIEEWFKDKTYILNTSLRESQAMTITEGMAAGLKPLIRNWIGAEEMYPEKYIWKSINDFKSLLEGDYNPDEYRDLVKKYDINLIYPKIEEIMENVLV